MTIRNALRDMNNAVLDLQAADYNTFERPLQQLSHALNSGDLKQITDELRSKADLDKFLEGANPSVGMVGSASLNWPVDKLEGLSLALQVIERSAQNPGWFRQFAFKYYNSGNKIAAHIRKVTTSVIIPFSRDFSIYVDEFESELSKDQPETGMASTPDKDELLEALFELGQHSGKRPSVMDAHIKRFPDWDIGRLRSTAEALLEDGLIMNPTGAMLHVDISSTGRKWVEQKRATPAPSATMIHIGSVNQSPFQVNSAGSHGVQNTSYSTNDLQSVVDLYRKHVDELGLDDVQRRRADAQVVAIEAELMEDPNSTIAENAGKSLKTILEGAVGSATGSALASSPLWTQLISLFG